jgi:hypothetical protein
MVGFNSLGFDYPVLHTLIRMGHSDANTLYLKAMSIINSQNDDEGGKWMHFIKPSDHFVQQIDLFKIHHFDNKARATSLKMLEFNMRSDNIEDLPAERAFELLAIRREKLGLEPGQAPAKTSRSKKAAPARTVKRGTTRKKK